MPDAREVAVRVLGRVEGGRAFAAAVLSSEGHVLTDPRDAALAYELVYGVLRRHSWLDHLLSQASPRGLKKIDPMIWSILRVGAYQIAFMQRIPASAAVSSAVTQAKRSRAPKLSGLVNALLRRLAQMPQASLVPAEENDINDLALLAMRLGLPAWIFSRLASAYGLESAVKIGKIFNGPARRTLRVNANSISRDEALRLLGRSATAGKLSPHAVDVEEAHLAKPLVDSGRAAYQDEAAQLAVPALDVGPNDRIWDACAGRGGKTAAMAMRLSAIGRLTATDRSSSKLERLVFELKRQGFQATAKTLDILASVAADPGDLGGPFDRILLDAPCSGTGTMGRRPEIRWRLTAPSVESLIDTQAQLLDRVADFVTPGGRLLYVVCSLFREEGLGQADRFLARHTDYSMNASAPRDWPGVIPWNEGRIIIYPFLAGTDGYQMLSFTRSG